MYFWYGERKRHWAQVRTHAVVALNIDSIGG